MTTRSFHPNNLGKFGHGLPTDQLGYVVVHDSPRYEAADADQLEEWSASRIRSIKSAALTEIATRRLAKWQAANV